MMRSTLISAFSCGVIKSNHQIFAIVLSFMLYCDKLSVKIVVLLERKRIRKYG
jgi:hypothetical protein